ncbi:MAG TPA: glycosyltransferase, partial [Steroidobacteraceae bacterium]
VFVLASHAEGMPMALLDAMAWRLPVITTPVGGIPQIIEPGRNGLLIRPGDIAELAAALQRLLADAGLRARLGSAARATIEAGFSLGASLERLAEIYQRLGVAPARHAASTRPCP